MERIIIPDTALHEQAAREKAAPAGWYSRFQVGAHEEQETRFVYEGGNPDIHPGTDFTYWEERRAVQLPVATVGHHGDSALPVLAD